VLTTSGVIPLKEAHIRSPYTRKQTNERATHSAITKTGAEGEAITTALFASNDISLQKDILRNFGVNMAKKVIYVYETFTLEQINPG